MNITLQPPSTELVDAQLLSLVAACWEYDDRAGDPPPFAITDIPMPLDPLYANGEWNEARRRAMDMIGLKKRPSRNFQALIQSLSITKRGARRRRKRPTLPASITPEDALKAQLFMLCDDPAATKSAWIYAIKWILSVYSQAASDSGAPPKHPLAPLVRAVQASKTASPVVPMQPSRAPNGIIPSTMHTARAFGYLPDIPALPAPMPGPQQPSLLPNFNPPPALIIPIDMIYTPPHANHSSLARGKAAPLPKRIFFEILTAIPKEGRNMQDTWQMECTLRDFKNWLYPPTREGATNFQMGRHLEQIRIALWEVSNIRMQRTLPRAKAPTDWLPIAVRGLPTADLNSPIILDIRLPPGSSGGALIDREAMRHYGRVSALQYSAALGLAYYWDKYATQQGNRILATKPQIAKNSQGHAIGARGETLLNSQGHPITGYNDPRIVFLDANGDAVMGKSLADRRAAAARERNWPAIRRIPTLSSADLLALCYPEEIADVINSPRRRDKLSRAKNALMKMQADRHCVIEPEESETGEIAWRILPETPAALTR